MGKWFGEVADAVRFKRETVSTTMNYLDRFVASPTGKSILFDRHRYQLAAMTALYTNLKIHEQREYVMDLDHVTMLSRGVHAPESVKAMEIRMLNAVRWKMYRPTPISFAKLMIDLILTQRPDLLKFSSYEKYALLDFAKIQIETTVN